MNPNETTAIGAEAIRFSELFFKGNFEVPWHQRYYDWTDEDVQALLLDIDEAVKERRRCYFLGAIILAEKGNGTWVVNDGQQRMVTVTLICAALCKRFADESIDAQREGLALRILFKLDSKGIWSLSESDEYIPRILPSENDRVFFNRMIRGQTIGSNGKLTTAWRSIDEFLSRQNSKSQWKDYFDYVVQSLEVACLFVPRALDPNAVFETINCRGKPLDQIDRIRNFFYSYFNSTDEQQKRSTVHDNLERVRYVFPASPSGQRNKAEEYVRCRMQCLFGFVKKDKLYREVRYRVREVVKNLPKGYRKPSDYVFELIDEITRYEDLELYRRITVPTANPEFLQRFEEKSQTTSSPRKISIFLGELKNYSVTHTLVFSLMSKYVHENDGRKQRRVSRLIHKNLSRLTTFVLRTAFVSPKFEPSLFERDFSEFATTISRSKNVPDKEFIEFLLDCDQRGYNALDDIKFVDFLTNAELQGSQKIKLFLLGINRVGRPDADVIYEQKCSVEHILPKSSQYWSRWVEFEHLEPKDWIHRIGNLTLTASLDNRPGTKTNVSFQKKKELYKNSSIAITRELSLIDGWSQSSIENRQQKIAQLAVKAWPFER